MKLGDMKLVIDAGLRYQRRTNETIAGLAAPLVAMTWSGGADPTAYAFCHSQAAALDSGIE